MTGPLLIYVVEDDPCVRDSLCQLLRLRGFRTSAFDSGEAFLDGLDAALSGSVVLLDLRLPGMSGLEVQSALLSRNLRWPVIVLTAHGDASSARNALKAGAYDFIEKPFDDAVLVSAITRAAADAEAAEAKAASRLETQRRMARLTGRERQVLQMVVDGHHNREIAHALGLSSRTVEVYKARLMDKLDVDRLADLIRLSLESPLD